MAKVTEAASSDEEAEGALNSTSAENLHEREPARVSTSESNDSGKPGNANGGHDYGNAQFNEQQRRALVEYMKTL